MRKYFQKSLLIIWTILCFALGALATLYINNKISSSGWAEAVSATATVLALALAVITFKSWQHQKIREDAYSTTKLYITTLVEIESKYLEIISLFNSIIPTPGMMILSKSENQKTLDALQDTHRILRLLTSKLISTKDELPFWGISLTGKALIEHDTLIQNLNAHLNAAYYLQLGLTNELIYEDGGRSYQSWLGRLRTCSEALNQSFNKRKSLTVKAMFAF